MVGNFSSNIVATAECISIKYNVNKRIEYFEKLPYSDVLLVVRYSRLVVYRLPRRLNNKNPLIP